MFSVHFRPRVPDGPTDTGMTWEIAVITASRDNGSELIIDIIPKCYLYHMRLYNSQMGHGVSGGDVRTSEYILDLFNIRSVLQCSRFTAYLIP